MRAVVLVGGEGTRLRPLTETIAKPLIDFLDRPFLHTVLDRLAAQGVEEAVLSSPYLEETFRPFLTSREGSAPAVTWITEDSPLGTGGAAASAAHVAGLDETFLAVNGDVLTDLDAAELVALHRRTGAMATIALAPVEDARPYGLVSTDGTRVLEFREKPDRPVPGTINAGTYVLEPDALASVAPGTVASIEREVFPGLIAKGRTVSALVSEAYWRDLGTPESYLDAHADAMRGAIRGIEARAPWVAASANVDRSARLGRWVTVGSDAVVEEGAEVDGSVLLRGSRVGPGASVSGSIVGPSARVGAGARLEGAILADGARVADGASAEGARVGPGEVLHHGPG